MAAKPALAVIAVRNRVDDAHELSWQGRHPSAEPVSPPSSLYGPVFAEMQLNRVFPDGKTFADAVPRHEVEAIRNAFVDGATTGIDLRRFAEDNFVLPQAAEVLPAHGERDLRRYIRSVWPSLCRADAASPPGGSRLPVAGRYVVPGGRFAELYYWDSYFSILGLVRDGHEDVAASMVDTFTDLLDTHGRIPNGTRSYYLSRSQPPLYFAMLDLLPQAKPAVRRRRLEALLCEHAFWVDENLAGRTAAEASRAVRMPDGALLNRYSDDCDTPRDESYLEDVCTAAASARPAGEVYRALRAGAESGWDFSSRWLADGGTLESIRTTSIVPVDLNAFLYGMERAIASLADDLCLDAVAGRFDVASRRRRAAMHRWLWHDAGYFCDFDLDTLERRQHMTAAALAPLFTGVATQAQAAAVARTTAEELMAPGGLRTTLVRTGEQWDWPNGWAPLQWIAFRGLRRYGHRRLARTIAMRWVATVDAEFQRTGWIHEKYDVESRTGGGGGEYAPQLGFGWTNGVTAAFLDMLRLERSSVRKDGCKRHEP